MGKAEVVLIFFKLRAKKIIHIFVGISSFRYVYTVKIRFLVILYLKLRIIYYYLLL